MGSCKIKEGVLAAILVGVLLACPVSGQLNSDSSGVAYLTPNTGVFTSSMIPASGVNELFVDFTTFLPSKRNTPRYENRRRSFTGSDISVKRGYGLLRITKKETGRVVALPSNVQFASVNYQSCSRVASSLRNDFNLASGRVGCVFDGVSTYVKITNEGGNLRYMYLSPTCSDGMGNQGETGIDCGGPCAVC